MDTFRFDINPPWPDLPRCNAVLNGFIRGRDYVVHRYRTTLCLKSVVHGSAFYHTPQGHFRVEEGSFLVLNRGQEYDLEITSQTRTETLCPFFQPGFLGHVAVCLTSGLERQLDEPAAPGGDVEFYERLYPKTGAVGSRLTVLRAGLRSGGACGPWLEDQLYGLAEDLLALRSGVRQEVAGFPGARPATRAELYRRLHRARDYIDSCFADKLSVEGIAWVARLSPYHFHRAFKRAFGETPMRRLQGRRLLAAQKLLVTTDKPVTSVCLEAGFESLGSFSWLFRKRFGASPREFRRHLRSRSKPQA